ncbi:peptidoglycan-binding protein [Streptacidiphilus sp. MAP12-16]|uniref:peptidoglycan-binding protein n=1 Tax=Streptacidiphilus sp. MAP12-16 TaxID=3156300 RepID=UPI003511C9CF
MRELKDASGRTLQELAGDTGYSSSSWERYLNGRLLPPRAAVEALAKIAGGEPVRLLARFEMAADAWQSQQEDVPSAETADAAPVGTPEAGTTAVVCVPDADAGPQPEAESGAGSARPRPRTGWPLIMTLGGAAALGAVITLLVVQPSQGAVACAPARTPAAVHKPAVFTCTYSRKAGMWYAGNSTTNTQQLVVDISGPDVAELQCLLQRVGITPGGIDGNFGPLTESAVIQAQKKFHLNIDGQVGPHTWAALRG